MKRLVAIAAIVVAFSLGWLVLGGTLVARTQSSDDAQRYAVASLWGPPEEQSAPHVTIERPVAPAKTPAHDASRATVPQDLTIARSRIDVTLALTQRQKGLLWYNTYTAAFAGTYAVRNDGAAGRATFSLPFPAQAATYDDVAVIVDGRRIPARTTNDGIVATLPLAENAGFTAQVRYRSNGLGTWTYVFGNGVSAVHDFSLAMHVDFEAIDFPVHTLAPTAKRRTGSGWDLTWTYHDLVAGYGLGMQFPERLQPGPLAERVTFWAPLSLGFYVFVMLVVTTLRRIDLHPVNYLFLSAAFFAFDLLFTYTVDRISIDAAFVLCSLVSLGLTVSYLRLVVGLRFAAVEAGLAQLFYQILFSLALFNEGSSGLSITIGAIVTLFVLMQVTGRIDWSERLGERPGATAAAR